MASNKHAQIRYKVLDDCFSNFGRKYYFEDLVDAVNDALSENYGEQHSGVKTRTVRSDISYIRDRAGEAGVEILVEDDGKGYFYRYSEPDFSIFKGGLGEDDLAQLKETIMMLQRFKGMPNFDWMSEMVVKLEDKLKLRGTTQSVIGYEENKDYVGLDWFKDLFDAIINQQVLTINYTKFSGESRSWTIHPYYIKQYNNRWFLFGLNDYNQRIANIPLDRIDNIEQLHKEFIPNTTVDFEHYFDDVVGVSVYEGEEKIKLRLKFSPERFPYVMTKSIHSSQHIVDVEQGIVEICVIPNNELEALILSYGDDVEVLAPDSYREKIKENIVNTYNKYTLCK